MNPVLLKPQTEIGAQVIVHGRIFATCAARDYQAQARPDAQRARELRAASAEADLIWLRGRGQPGGGQPARRRHRQHGLCRGGRLPVVLVGDIDKRRRDRGAGRHARAARAGRARAAQGLPDQQVPGRSFLFDDAHPIIAARTGMRSYGVVPGSSRPASCRPRTSWGSRSARAKHWRDQDRRPSARADRELRRSRPADAEPDVQVQIVPPARRCPAMPIS